MMSYNAIEILKKIQNIAYINKMNDSVAYIKIMGKSPYSDTMSPELFYYIESH